MENITVKRKDGSRVNFTVDEFTRWMCMVEAFHYIEQKAEDLSIDAFNLLKPAAINEYIHGNDTKKINGRFPSMKHDIIYEIEHGIL